MTELTDFYSLVPEIPQLNLWFNSYLFRPKNFPRQMIFGQIRGLHKHEILKKLVTYIYTVMESNLWEAKLFYEGIMKKCLKR